MTILSIRELSASLGGREVLSKVTTALSGGELAAVIGPNGAGKTTFLRALCGLVPASGQARVDDMDLLTLDPAARARALAYLEQRGVIAWPLPVSEIVALGRMPFATGRARDAEAIGRALALCDLETLADRPATELSGGERARVLLARVLASDAPLLLLDEPVASLDPARQIAVMELLSAQAREGRCVVAVLHDLTLALRHADRVLLFAEGRLAADATPSTLLASGSLDSVFGVRIETATTAGGLLVGASPAL